MNVHLPSSIDEAIAVKSAHPDAVPVAGGTDLYVCWPEQPDRHDRTYVDLSALSELRYLRWTDATLELGALTTYWDVVEDGRVREVLPMLIDAGRQVGAIQIQSRGTWAGNIANASPAADGVPVLMAYDAEIILTSYRGERVVALDTFYRGYKDMDLASDELITAIRLPLRTHDVEIFEKIGSRRAQAITKIGLAVAHSAAGWRIVANSMAPTVRRCRHLEALIESGATIGRPEDLLEAIDLDVTPIDDVRSTRDYRRTVMSRVLFAALSRRP